MCFNDEEWRVLSQRVLYLLLQVLAMSQIPLLQIWFLIEELQQQLLQSVAPAISELQTTFNNEFLALETQQERFTVLARRI